MTAEKDGNPIVDKSNEQMDVAARARARIVEARQKAGDVISATREKGEAVIEDTRDKTYRAAAETNRLFQEHPIAAVAAAAALGAAVGIFMPRLAIATKAGKLAGRAAKAAAGSSAAQVLVTGVTEGRNAALQGAVAKAVTSVGSRLLGSRSKRTAAETSKPAEEEA